MGKDRHQPVGKRALLGAVLGRHIDPRIDLMATPGLAPETTQATERFEELPVEAEASTFVGVVESHELKAPKKKSAKKTKAVKKMAKTQPAAQPKRHWWQRSLDSSQQSKLLVIVCISLLLILAPLAGAYNYYDQRVLPGLKVAGVPMDGKTLAELKTAVQAQAKTLSFAVHDGSTVTHPSLEQVGVNVDVDATVDAAYKLRRSDPLDQRFAWWKSLNVPLKVAIDQDKLTAYNKTVSQNSYHAAVDAKVVFAGVGYVINPEKKGQNSGVQTAVQALSNGIAKPGVIDLQVVEEIIEPAVHASELTGVQAQANSFLNTDVRLSGAGKIFKPTKDQINAWISLNTNPTKKPYSATIDSAKVGAYVDSVAKSVNVAPVDQLVGKNQDQAGAEQILTAGKNGAQLSNKATLTNTILEAMSKGRDINAAMAVGVIPFKTISVNSYDRYVDVSLTSRRLTAYEKGTAVATYPTSTGDRYHATPPGVYTIYGKTASQTMYGGSKVAGDYFYLPNVQWISWFYGPYAIHGAYWNNFIGVRDTSHGCVNMSNADAKFIYDWAPIGTKVVIHV